MQTASATHDIMGDPPDSIPRSAFWLGTGGLVPFVVLTSALFALPDHARPQLLFWLTAYAAVILSFVGAVHWGIALVHAQMREPDRSLYMGWSIVPALAAWMSLLLPAKTGLLLMAATFAVHFAADRQLAQRFPVPAWYVRLRGGLTGVVVLCLLLALAQAGSL
jgi:hypothetical protein